MKTQAKPAKMGRPPIFKGGSVVATFRISKEQAKAIEKASTKARKDKSEWMREALDAAAAKILDATGFEPA